MSKQAIAKVTVRQPTKFADGEVRTIRFVAGPKRVVVTCRGLPRIVVARAVNKFGFRFAATVKLGKETQVSYGNTPKAAFAEAVEVTWGV